MASMFEFTERHPLLTRILGRIVLNRVFMGYVLGPLMTVARHVQAYYVAFGPKPRFKAPPGNSIFPPEWPQAEKMNADLALIMAYGLEGRRAREARANAITEKDRATVQSMTWGTAGAAVLIVVAIATSSKTFSGPAISIAEGCFAVTIPLLIVFGFAFSHQWDPVRAPPTPQEMANLNALIVTGQLIFAMGLAALLWSFNPRVSIAFLVAWLLALRAFKNLVGRRIASKTAEEIYDAILKARSGAAANQPTASGESTKADSHA